jgi:hypothetical protein
LNATTLGPGLRQGDGGAVPSSVQRALRWVVLTAALLVAAPATAADFATPGGPEPAKLEEVVSALRKDPYDLELLISFGTSKSGSAGHLALAIREPGQDDDLVYSANFYADRDPKHAQHFYTQDLMVRVPKTEYLFGTRSSLGPKASFGLDYGEVYKRALIGVRAYGVPAAERAALASFFGRLNDDFHRRAANTEYHNGEIVYDYMDLNCAKTVGAAFRWGAGYKDLEVKQRGFFSRLSKATSANTPIEMALKLIRAWDARGYTMDVVLYKKYEHSPYVDPREEEPVAFKDLPNRFPSVLSLDFRADQGQYEDYDNLFAMYLLYNLGRYSVRIDPATRAVQIELAKEPLPYARAVAEAERAADADSKGFLSRTLLRPIGRIFWEPTDNTHLYDFDLKPKP